jgi:hypothetical protein
VIYQLTSAQLNIVIVVDVSRAVEIGSLQQSLFMMDNSPDSHDKGTDRLSTRCMPGQVINWGILPLEAPFDSVRISNIRFIEQVEVCTKLKVYGKAIPPFGPYPERIPDYDYWAGLVRPDLTPGVYHYHLEVEMKVCDASLCIAVDSPSLNVVPA